MDIELNNFLVALIFLLPGFLASRLISARTAAKGRGVSAFQETFESLLRSVYIHLIIAFLVYIVLLFLVLKKCFCVNRIINDGFEAYYAKYPFQVVTFLFAWLLIAFLLAVIFGYFWDPLEALFSRLVNRTGTKSEDVFYQLREIVSKKRDNGEKDFQLWIQARLKNGYTYQGEFYFVGYRHEGMSRELVLANVTFYPYTSQIGGQLQKQPKYYDFVLLDVENCESLEILFASNPSPSEEDNVN